MKVDLKKQLMHPALEKPLANQNGNDLTVGNIAERALWNMPASQGGKEHSRLAMEIHGKDEIDLPVEDIATIKQAIEASNNTLVWKAFVLAVDPVEDTTEEKQ